MTRSGASNYAGLRSALVLGSVAASVIGARVVTERDAAKWAAQAEEDAEEPTLEPTLIPTSTPMPTPTPQIIIVYDLPPVPTAMVLGQGPEQPLPAAPGTVIQAAPQLPPPVVSNTGGGGGGGGGGGAKPAKPKKSKSSK